jgi:hypothetical protein
MLFFALLLRCNRVRESSEREEKIILKLFFSLVKYMHTLENLAILRGNNV